MNETKSVKALKKQMAAAIAMVCVAAIALGSSTYAWFVASNSVTAEGMTVQAQSESGLAISYDDSNWGTSATAGVNEGVKLYPASTKDLASWSHATAEASNSTTAVQSTREDITDDVFGGENKAFEDDNGYVFMKEFKIRSTATEALSKGLYVKNVTVTGATQKMSVAMRVGVRYTDTSNSGNNKAFIYAPVKVGETNPTTSYNWYKDAKDANGSAVTLASVGEDNSVVIPSTTSISSDPNSAVKVQIYVWFEGEDAQLYSDNFKAEDLHITVDFSSIQP